MIEPRLESRLQVDALRRFAEAKGGFATILRRGDAVSGAIILIIRLRGGQPTIWERFPLLDGGAEWQQLAQNSATSPENLSGWLNRRGDRDPDLWILELDVADDKRLAEIIAFAP